MAGTNLWNVRSDLACVNPADLGYDLLQLACESRKVRDRQLICSCVRACDQCYIVSFEYGKGSRTYC